MEYQQIQVLSRNMTAIQGFCMMIREVIKEVEALRATNPELKAVDVEPLNKFLDANVDASITVLDLISILLPIYKEKADKEAAIRSAEQTERLAQVKEKNTSVSPADALPSTPPAATKPKVESGFIPLFGDLS